VGYDGDDQLKVFICRLPVHWPASFSFIPANVHGIEGQLRSGRARGDPAGDGLAEGAGRPTLQILSGR